MLFTSMRRSHHAGLWSEPRRAHRHHPDFDKMNTQGTWKYLVRKPKSVYKQLFVRDRWVAARTLYGQTLGEEARTAEEVAADYALPLDVVLEAIAYCESKPPEIREDWEREEALMHMTGMDKSENRHNASPLLLTPQDRARINRL